MGTRTFGKGLIQDVSPLPYDGAALKVTVGRYYTPSGRCLQELDYEKERADGGLNKKKIVEKRETFRTLVSKRPIESGGGVAPDVVVEPDTLTKAETALLRSGVVGKFTDDWIDARPGLSESLFAQGSSPDADAAAPLLNRRDLEELKAVARKAVAKGDLRSTGR